MNKEQAIAAAARMKSYFPYRLHFVFTKDGQEWQNGCSHDMRKPRKLVREGARVELLQ